MENQVSFSLKLFSFLSLLEKIAAAVALIGFTLKFLHWENANTLLILSLMTLAMIYFLMAFRPPAKTNDGEKSGFVALLTLTILPKLAWISCSILAVGILFLFLNLGGASEMLMIGTAGGVATVVFLGLLLATGNEGAKSQAGVLYRVAPMLVLIGLMAFEVIT